MKNTIKKLFAAVIAFAIIATLCPMTLYAAGETTHAEMYIDDTYQAWLTNGTKAPGTNIKTAAIVEMSSGMDIVGPSTATYDNQKFFASDAPLADANRPALYSFKTTGDNLIVTLPEKKTGYDLHTVGIVTSHVAVAYQQPFDYMYSTDKSSWTNVEDVSYTSSPVSRIKNSYSYYDVLTVPTDAKYIKIVRNSNPVTENNYNEKYPGVMGFYFGYVPTTNNDIIKITASRDTEIIDLMTTGMLKEGNNNFFSTGLPYKVDNVSQYGLAVVNKMEMVFNALDGYKITAVEADSYNANNASRSLSIKLGNTTVKQTAASTNLVKLSATSETGEDSFSIIGAAANPGALYNISITMEKVVTSGTVDVHGNIPQQNEAGVASLGDIKYSMVDDAKDNGDGTYTNYTDAEQATLVNNIISTYTAEINTCAVRADAENFAGLRSVGGYAIFKAPQDAYIQNFDCYIRYLGANGPNKRLRLSVAETLDGPWIDVDSTWEYVTEYTSNGRGVNIYRQKTVDGVKLNAKYLKVKYPVLNYSLTNNTHVVLGAFKYDWTVEKAANTYEQSGTWHIGGTQNPYWIADTADTNHTSVLADYTDKKAVGMFEYCAKATQTVTEEEFAAGGYVGKPAQAGDEVFRGVYSGIGEPGGFVTVQAPDDAIATKAVFHFYIVGDAPEIAVWTSDTIDGEYTEVETTIENLGVLAGMKENHYIYALTADNLKNARFIKLQLNYGSAVKLGAVDIDYTRAGMPCIFKNSANGDSTYTVTATNYTVNDADCKLIVAQYDMDNKINTLAGVEVVDNVKINGRGINVKTITPVSGADKISVMAIDAKTNKPLANPIVIYPGE